MDENSKGSLWKEPWRESPDTGHTWAVGRQASLLWGYSSRLWRKRCSSAREEAGPMARNSKNMQNVHGRGRKMWQCMWREDMYIYFGRCWGPSTVKVLNAGLLGNSWERTFFRKEVPLVKLITIKKSLVAQTVKNRAKQETWVRSLGWEDPLEEGIATHPSILAWRIPMDRGAWWATVRGVRKSQTQLGN